MAPWRFQSIVITLQSKALNHLANQEFLLKTTFQTKHQIGISCVSNVPITCALSSCVSMDLLFSLSSRYFFRSSPTDGWWQTDSQALVVQSLVQATTSHPPASYNCALHVSEHEWNSRNDHFAPCRALRSCPLLKGLQHPPSVNLWIPGEIGTTSRCEVYGWSDLDTIGHSRRGKEGRSWDSGHDLKARVE